MLERPAFSLIVPTLNRKEELRTLLLCLQNQTFKNFEILIVDQNEDDKIAGIIREFSHYFHLTHIRQLGKGASKARNAGLSAASGHIMTFPDDDCEYPLDLLEKVFAIFDQSPKLDGITCSSKDKESAARITRFSNKKGSITKFNILRRIVEFTIFVRSETIKGFYFDENLGPGATTQWWSDEGPDLVLRLINKGAHFVYFPELIIYHPSPVKMYNDKTFTRSYKYGLGRGKYLRKHVYPFWFVMYVWGLYVAGIVIGCGQFNFGKMKYYYFGLRGRIKGFID